MIRVGVSGASGRMGRLVAGAIGDAADMEVHGLYDPAVPASGPDGAAVSADRTVLEGADVIVEFTRPDVVLDNLAAWRGFGAHAVVGTSGFDEARLAEVRALWGTGPPNCLIAPNFSIGAVVMLRLAEIAAPHFAAAEVIELHHDQKADAPSGTALETARRIAAANPDQRRAVESAELAAGARGASIDGVPVHAVRLPGLVAHQQAVFGSSGERLTISHDTSDRQSFMPGVLLSVRSVGGLDAPVTVGIETLLGI